MSYAQLPLFPLNMVLFPGGTAALHVFEERYRLMIGRCLAESAPFGVLLIRSGSEVDPDEPLLRLLQLDTDREDETIPSAETVTVTIGTSARIAESHRFNDGRYYLSVAGVRRFRLQRLVQQEPYRIGEVSYLDDEEDAQLPALADRLRALYQRYWAAVGRMTGERDSARGLPDDPGALSYALAGRVQVDLLRKQRWLEADAATRLRELAEAIEGELRLLPRSRRG